MKKQLWIPILFFVGLITLDRILTTPWVRSYTERRAEYYFYAMKDKILQDLLRERKEPSFDENLLLVFGTSHLGELDPAAIERERPGTHLYNFSAPSASYTYLNYYLEKIIQKGVKPRAIVLELFLESMTTAADQYTLLYSLDFPYLWQYKEQFDYTDWDSFIRTRLFLTNRFPVETNTIWKRIQHPSDRAAHMQVRKFLTQEASKFRAGIPNLLLADTSEEALQRETKTYFEDKYLHFQFSPQEEFFLHRFLTLAKQNDIPVLLWSTALYGPLFQKVEETDHWKTWQNKLGTLQTEFGYPILDMQKRYSEMECRNFVDPQHLSGGCYPEVTRLIMRALPE